MLPNRRVLKILFQGLDKRFAKFVSAINFIERKFELSSMYLLKRKLDYIDILIPT